MAGLLSAWTAGADGLTYADPASTGTVLGIWAHPDDETFVAGGLLADAARRGARVRCLHVTAGEAGQCAQGATTPARLATTRVAELSAALACLGVDGGGSPHVLAWPDGRLSRVPERVGVQRIREELVAVEPDVVVTFGPDGFTGHPDHRVLSHWVTTALSEWGRRRVTLLHAAVTQAWAKRIVPALDEFNIFWSGYPKVAGTGTGVEQVLDRVLLDRKVAALRAHASQMQPLFAAYGEGFVRALAAVERFRLADIASQQSMAIAARPPHPRS